MGTEVGGPPAVFIVEDDDAVRDAIAMLLRTAGLSVQTFASGPALLRQFRPEWRGCLILDVRMPQMDGLELQEALASRRCRMPIVFLTAHGDIPMAVRAMQRGAIDFLEKPHDATRLVLVASRALRVASEHDGSAGAGGRRWVDTDALPALLTKREREVLELVLRGRTTRAIAEAMCISAKTVEFHRGRVWRKLGVTSLAELFGLFASPRLDAPAPFPVAGAVVRDDGCATTDRTGPASPSAADGTGA